MFKRLGKNVRHAAHVQIGWFFSPETVRGYCGGCPGNRRWQIVFKAFLGSGGFLGLIGRQSLHMIAHVRSLMDDSICYLGNFLGSRSAREKIAGIYITALRNQ